MAQMMISADIAKLHTVLGRVMYSSKYSWISEICQNAVDSHRMARIKEPVMIGVRYDEVDRNNLIFYVRDVGLSFKDEADFLRKMCTILETGKDQEKTASEFCAMGKHGLGSISVSAYQKQWNYRVVCPDGRLLTAIFKELPTGIDYEITDCGIVEESKSVLFEVIIPPMGFSALIANMKLKLAYFKDILFQFPEDLIRGYPELLTLNTDFEIFQSEDFQISTFSTTDFLHISLDQYSYSINWDVLGISPIEINIGLRFTMADGLESNATREELQYDDNYVPIIMAKIKKVATWFVDRYNSEIPDEFTSVKTMEKVRNQDPYVVINGEIYPVQDLLEYTDKKVKKLKFKGVTEKNYLNFVEKTNGGDRFFIQKYKISSTGGKNSTYGIGIWGYKPIFVDKPITPDIMEYIKIHYHGSSLIYKREVPLLSSVVSDTNAFSYEYIYGLDRYMMKKEYKTSGHNIWRTVVEQSKLLENSVMRDKCIVASDIVAPAIAKNKKSRFQREKISLEDLTGELNIKYAAPLEHSNGEFSCKFVSSIIKVKELYKLPYLHIYGVETDRKKLDLIYRLYRYHNKCPAPNIKTCTIGISQHSYLKKLNLHNFMHIDTFLEGKNKLFRQLITSYLIDYELVTPYSHIFKCVDLITRHIRKKIAQDLIDLENYVLKYSNKHTRYIKYGEIEPLVITAHSLKAYDLMVWEKFQAMKKKIDIFDYVDILHHPLRSGDGGMNRRAVRMVNNISRYRKIRMDKRNYKKCL